jgi:20S proteasome alpha/beta subunit
MTQTLVGFNQRGIVMASDSRATRFDAQGRKEYFSVEKLFPLGRYAGIVSGGSGVSIPLTHLLRREVLRRGLLAVEDILKFAVPFLSEHYGTFLAEHGPEKEEELRRLNFIIAGYSLEDPDHQYQIYLVESENNALPFKVTPVKPLLVMPRNLSMEMRLFKALKSGSSLDELTRICQEFLEKVSALQEEIGPPFFFATITRAGYQSVSPPNGSA